jgi:hypothetical protein
VVSFLTGVSLLLCVASVVLWVRSHAVFDDLNRISTSRTPGDYTQHLIRLGSSQGQIIFTRRDIIWPSYNPSFSHVTSTWDQSNGVHFTHEPPVDLDRKFPKQPTERSWELQFARIRFTRIIVDASLDSTDRRNRFKMPYPDYHSPATIGVVLFVPHAYIAALLGTLPVAVLLTRWRRPRRGRCRACSYDLTGNISGVCPECGMAVPGKAGV